MGFVDRLPPDFVYLPFSLFFPSISYHDGKSQGGKGNGRNRRDVVASFLPFLFPFSLLTSFPRSGRQVIGKNKNFNPGA